MAELELQRLTLSLSGFTATEGERLGRLIADGLAGLPLDGMPERLRDLRVRVSHQPGANPERLARDVVAEIARQLT
jgi:hypothetical protein